MMITPASESQLEAVSSSDDDSARAPTVNRRQALTWTLCALLPVSVLVALLVLHLMAASAAAATGGCGGG